MYNIIWCFWQAAEILAAESKYLPLCVGPYEFLDDNDREKIMKANTDLICRLKDSEVCSPKVTECKLQSML